MYAKELLDLILNPSKTNKICLLCLKTNEITLDVFEIFEVQGKDFCKAKSLYFMMEELFPTHEILMKQACEKCSKLIIQFYILMRRNQVYQNSIAYLVVDLNYKIDRYTENTEDDSYIIDLSKYTKRVCKKRLDKDNSNKEDEPNKIHERTVPKQRKLKYETLICDICGKTSKTARSLSIHRKGHQSKPCPYCQKVLKNHQHFNVHVRNHETGNRRTNTSKTVYRCNDCNYKSFNKQTLEAHINRNHLNFRPYICEICCKGFYKKGNLNEHRLTHSRVKLNTCDTCGERFGRKKSLLEHLRLHSGERPYSCEICGEKFVTVGRRNTHVKRKHGEKQEICGICGLAFSLKYDVSRHMRLVHEISM